MTSPFHGHLWTVWPRMRYALRPVAPPPSRHWRTTLDDPDVGEVGLSGRFHEAIGGELLVVVHGLGGSHRSSYMVDAALAAGRAHVSCLRLDLRGADRRGLDFYHAGLTADLRAALAADDLARFERIYLLGYSLGGHVSLRFAAETGLDPRVRAVATVCTPLDLEAGANEIDQPRGRFYRGRVLGGLKEIYEAVARRRDVPITMAEARAISTIRQWDERIIAPRFGFDSAEAYWRSQSAGSVLDQVAVPTLMLLSRHDPMVFFHTLEPHLGAGDNVRSKVLTRGGHVGFPGDIDLGWGERGTIEDQLLAWLRSNPGREG